MHSSDFARTSPKKVFQRAAAYTKNLWKHHELPKNISKSMVVKQHAENHKDQVDFAIRRSSYQLQLYRRKEQEDAIRRTTYSQKLAASEQKVAKNEREIAAKHAKEALNYQKHLRATYRKYQEGQKRNREQEKESSYQLRKELQEFYKKEAQRKRSAQAKQVSVGTCYQDAIDKINNIHKMNEERAIKAQEELHQEMTKNSHYHEILSQRRRSLSSMNQQKSRIFENNLSIIEKRENSFIQKYGKNEDGSLNAFKHLEEEEMKTKKRLGEFFKTRTQKWSQEKKRVDQANAEIPQKCTSILERTNNSFWKQSISSFRTTAREWQNRVIRNKSAIKSQEQRKKDEIMGTHYDLRLKNTSSLKVSQRMNSMRLHAKKLASQYL